jgi:hypothetical protein
VGKRDDIGIDNDGIEFVEEECWRGEKEIRGYAR